MRGSVKYLPSVLLCLVVLGLSRPAAAQDAPVVPLIEVSGGYNFLKGDVPTFSGRDVPPAFTTPVTFANGFYADLAIYMPQPKKTLALVLQYSMNPKEIEGEEAGQRQYMAGIRFNSRKVQKMVLFAQLLGGNVNSKFGNAGEGFDEWTGFFTVQYGGGATFMITPKVGIRFGADFLQSHGKHDSTILNEGFNEFRFSTGIVLPFGTR